MVLQLTTPKISEKSGVVSDQFINILEIKNRLLLNYCYIKKRKFRASTKAVSDTQQQTAIQDIITLSIAFGFESLKSDHGFFIEILKIGMPYSDSEGHKY